MKKKPQGPKKVTVNLRITKEAQDILLQEYASPRTMGMFISRLIMEHHDRVKMWNAIDTEQFLRESFGLGEDD